jgi:hypothetical protein
MTPAAAVAAEAEALKTAAKKRTRLKFVITSSFQKPFVPSEKLTMNVKQNNSVVS